MVFTEKDSVVVADLFCDISMKKNKTILNRTDIHRIMYSPNALSQDKDTKLVSSYLPARGFVRTAIASRMVDVISTWH